MWRHWQLYWSSYKLYKKSAKFASKGRGVENPDITIIYNSTITGSAETDDIYNSISAAVEKVKGQLKKHKGKLKNKRPDEIADTKEELTRPSTDVDGIDV